MAPRLKRLELHGYKTFANKTVFDFPGNITAIVGPNGSGKSNIADSIRWVLGEQAYSLLRGKKTEDMIFTGSEDRPRSSMASAQILFDNEDGWLPIDFSEVSISRRAYRDGENEYLLNNQKVRLKEVAELLAQTGLAERTYTVIGQGLVDIALSLKPDERRKFFEEAAGIGLYRGRREEALTRLENTRRNLERINDIVTELAPRQRSLEKQVKKVQEFERIRSELQTLLREWYGYQWHSSQRELTRAKEFHRNQDLQYRHSQDQQMVVEKQYDLLKLEIANLREKLDAWHLELSDQHRLREQASRNLAVTDERLAGLRDKHQNLHSQMIALEESEKIRKVELEQFQVDEQKQAAELVDLQKTAKELKEKIKTIEDKRAGLEDQIKITNNELIELENQNTRNSIEEKEIQNQVLGNENELKNLEDTIQQFTRDKARTLISITKSQEELSVIHEHLVELDEKLSAASARREVLLTKIQSVSEESLRNSSDLAKLKSEKQVFEEADKNFLGYREAAKGFLEAIRSGKLKADYQTLLSQIEIPQEYEVAIEAALGENIDGIILEKSADLESALSFMETTDNGRAIFLHTETVRDAGIIVEKSRNVIGIALELVRYPTSLQQTMQALLGRFLLVNDRSTAKKIYRTLPSGCAVVTLKGEVFWQEGIVVAGKTTQRNRVARPRIKMEIDQLISQKQKESQNIIESLQDLNNEQVDLEKEISQLQEKRRILLDAQSVAEKEHTNLISQKEQFVQRTDWLATQKANLTSANDGFNDRIISLKDIQAVNQSKIKNIKEQLSGLHEEIKLHSLIELQSQSIERETRIAVLLKAKDSIDQRLIEKQNLMEQDQTRIADLTASIKNLDSDLTSTIKNREDLAEKEGLLNQKIAEIQQLVAPAEKELSEKEKTNQEFIQNVQNLRQATTNLERYATQAQLEVSRHNDKLDRLRERIEDDFGLVAFPYATNISGPAPLPFEGMVEQLPVREEIATDLEDNINQQRSALRRIGPINQEAEKEYEETRGRIEFLNSQIEDLKKADADLRQVISELDILMKQEFKKTFEAVAREFQDIFSQLFIGGHAKLTMIDNEDQGTAGVDIEARLPGRREQGLSLLSGGERSLTAVALIFALLRVSPTPFCVLDEVDAMLDESNVGRFCEILMELSRKTQFIIITHNRNTVQVADVIYGVTMGKDSASQVISLKMDEISDELIQ
jgi:chromosome segregation protein